MSSRLSHRSFNLFNLPIRHGYSINSFYTIPQYFYHLLFYKNHWTGNVFCSVKRFYLLLIKERINRLLIFWILSLFGFFRFNPGGNKEVVIEDLNEVARRVLESPGVFYMWNNRGSIVKHGRTLYRLLIQIIDILFPSDWSFSINRI